MTCRRCTICEGLEHHWLEDCDENDPPAHTHRCKHCPALGTLCEECDNAYGDEEDCDTCQQVGVVYVRDDEEVGR